MISIPFSHTIKWPSAHFEKSYTKSSTEWETLRWKCCTEIWITPKFGCPAIQMVHVTYPRWLPCLYMLADFQNFWNQKVNDLETCSFEYSSTCTTKVVQMMPLGWHWPILWQSQMWSPVLLYGKKLKQWIFSEIIVVCDIKVGRCRQLNKYGTWSFMSTKGQSH